MNINVLLILSCIWVNFGQADQNTKCLALGATVPTGAESTIFQAIDKLFYINSTLAAVQLDDCKSIFLNLTKALSARVEHVVDKGWEDAQGNPVPPIFLPILGNREPTILTSEADPELFRLKCYQKLGILLEPLKLGEYNEIARLLTHLDLESTYINQYIKSTSSKFFNRLDNDQEISLPITDHAKWTNYTDKALGINKEGKYVHFEKSDNKQFICLTPVDFGSVSEFAEKELKSILTSIIHELNIAHNFMSSLLQVFNMHNVQQHIASDTNVGGQLLFLSFPRVAIIKDFMAGHQLNPLTLSGITQGDFTSLKQLLDMIIDFNANNKFVNNVFKLDCNSDFFMPAPETTFRTNESVLVAHVNKLSNHAVISLPLMQTVQEFTIVPFVHDDKIFKYKYFVRSPLINYVTNQPLITECSRMFDGCNQIGDILCAENFLHGKIVDSCMESANNYNAINVLNCKGSDGAALVVSTSEAMDATLDCFSENDFHLTLEPGTTWLQPCVLKSGNNVLNSISGPVPFDLKSAYYEIIPGVSSKDSDIFWYLIPICLGIAFCLSIILTIFATTCYIRRRGSSHSNALALQPNAPPEGLPMQVINYNLQGTGQGMAPPTSGFIEPMD